MKKGMRLSEVLGLEIKSYAVNFDLNNGCQLRCTMCRPTGGPSVRDQTVLPIDVFSREVVPVLARAAHYQFGCYDEPTLVPYFEEAMGLLPPERIGRMNTNGMLLTVRKIDVMAASAKFCLVKISCDGSTKETFEKIRVKGVFETVVRHATYAAKKFGSETVALVFTLQQGNIHELTGVVELAARIGVGTVIMHSKQSELAWCGQRLDTYLLALEAAKKEGVALMESGQLGSGGYHGFAAYRYPPIFLAHVPLYLRVNPSGAWSIL